MSKGFLIEEVTEYCTLPSKTRYPLKNNCLSNVEREAQSNVFNQIRYGWIENPSTNRVWRYSLFHDAIQMSLPRRRNCSSRTSASNCHKLQRNGRNMPNTNVCRPCLIASHLSNVVGRKHTAMGLLFVVPAQIQGDRVCIASKLRLPSTVQIKYWILDIRRFALLVHCAKGWAVW
jgi:hypothetical protein